MNKYEGGKYSANALIKYELEKEGFSVKSINDYIVATLFGEDVIFNATETTDTSLLASRLAKNKFATNEFLRSNGVSVPTGQLFKKDNYKEAYEFSKKLKNVVVKPVNGNKGNGVSVGVKEKDFSLAWESALAAGGDKNKGVLVEEQFIDGEEVRYIVVEGECVGAVKRVPPKVVGDGVKSVQQLLNDANEVRRSNPGLKNRLIKIDDYRKELLRAQGLTLDSIVEKDKEIIIDHKAGLSTGGEPYEVFGEVHDSLKKVAERAAKSIPGLDVAGVDIIAISHYKEVSADDYVVIELNTKPGIAGHHYPARGAVRNIASFIVKKKKEKIVSRVHSILTALDLANEKVRGERLEDISRNFPANRLIAKEAVRLGAKIFVAESNKIIAWKEGKAFSFYNGSVERYNQGAIGKTKTIRKIVRNKSAVKEYLRANGVSVPNGTLVSASDLTRIVSAAEYIGYPVCVKPVSGRRGKSVYVNVKNRKDLTEICECFPDKYDFIIVEEYVSGFDARITTIDGKLVAASLRLPPSVIGDGSSTVTELVNHKVADRVKNKTARARSLTIDQYVESYLSTQGMSSDSVVAKGERIFLRENSNISTGAEAHNITDMLSSRAIREIEKIAYLFPDFVMCGIDVIFENDPRVSPDDGFKVIEINSSPGILGHHYPHEGKPVNIAKKLVEAMLA